MKNILILISFIAFAMACNGNKEEKLNLVLENDTILLWKNYKSEFVKSRNIEIWLPEDYGKDSSQRYKLVLFQDGQNVFDAKTSSSGVEWGADEVMDSLLHRKLVMPSIVVAIWSTDLRLREYLPILEDKNGNPEAIAETFWEKQGFTNVKEGEPKLLSDLYVKFLAEELIPDLRAKFTLSPFKEDITMIGSGEGALISLKAFCKYPDIIGNIACMSPQWNLADGYGESLIKLLPTWLPEAENRRIYFDRGTKGSDAQTKDFQNQVDLIFANKGYKRGRNYLSIELRGADTSEGSLRARLHKPFQFIQRK